MKRYPAENKCCSSIYVETNWNLKILIIVSVVLLIFFDIYSLSLVSISILSSRDNVLV